MVSIGSAPPLPLPLPFSLMTAPPGSHLLQLLGEDRQALHLVVADRVDEELGAEDARAAGRVFISGTSTFGEAAQHLAGVARAAGRGGAGGRSRSASPRSRTRRAAALDRRRRSSPSRAPAARRPRRRRPRASGSSSASVSSFAARSSRHQRVVGGVVADVAGAVLLLEAADPVLQARACRGSPRAARRARRAGRAGTRRRRSGPSAKCGVDLGQRRRCRGSATARRSWRGRCRESRITGVR